MTRPTLDEVKSQGQPRWVVERVNDEHLFGRLYMRKISPRVTWVLAAAGWSPNAVTVAFIGCGVTAGVLIAFGGLATAIAALLLTQLALLFDCSDGELARLTGRTSARGVYLDRVGHYLCDSAMLVGLGIRSQGALTSARAGGARVQRGQQDVVQHRAVRHQVERLEHEPDPLGPQPGPHTFGRGGGGHPAQPVLPR